MAGYDKGTMTLDAPRLIDVTVVLDGPQLAAQDLEVSWHARHLLSPSAADCATRRASAALSTRADPRSWCGASHRADTEQVPVKGGGRLLRVCRAADAAAVSPDRRPSALTIMNFQFAAQSAQTLPLSARSTKYGRIYVRSTKYGWIYIKQAQNDNLRSAVRVDVLKVV